MECRVGHDGRPETTRINAALPSEATGAATALLPVVRPQPEAAAATVDGTIGAVGPYRIVRAIGSGGMGRVYEAIDPRLDRRVALKTLRSGAAEADELQIARFRTEAAILARLRHPHIVRVHDVGRDGGLDWYAMDLVVGCTFAQWLRERQPSWQDRAALLGKVARALDHAHRAGVVHRDLNPANILVGHDGEPFVADFGLALDRTRQGPAPEAGTTCGSPLYMAPEQARGEHDRVGPAADVWSLGALLYEALTGRPPFTGAGHEQVMRAVIGATPARPRRIDPAIPADLEAIALRCLRKHPAARYAGAGALADDLARYGDGLPVQARRLGIAGRLWRAARRHPHGATLVAVAVLATVAALGWAALDWQRRWRGWQSVFDRDFTREQSLSGIEVWSRDLAAPAAPAGLDAAGLRLVPEVAGDPSDARWCWLAQPAGSDLRVEAELQLDGSDAVEICLGARRAALATWWHVPPGHVCKLGGWGGNAAMLSVGETPRGEERSYATAVHLPSRRPLRVLVERRGERFSVSLDGRELLHRIDPLPLAGDRLDGVGLRWYQPGTRLRSLRVWRLALPETASPLVAGDALARRGHLGEAYAQYRVIADDCPGTATAEAALVKAYLAAGRLAGHERELAETRARLERDFPAGRYRVQVLTVDALRAWGAGRHEQALALLPALFALDPDTRVVLDLLSLPRQPLPAAVGQRLLAGLAATTGVTCIQVSDLGLESLAPLAGMPLTKLDCTGNRLTDLDALAGMPLASLHAGRNRIERLDGLRGLPLRELRLDGNRIADLAPLAGLPLEQLVIDGNQVADLRPLAGLRLVELSCDRNRIADLRPLAGLRLTSLSVDGNAIADLAPLAGLPLGKLSVIGNRIADLRPLAGMPLLDLLITDNQVTDLRPLAGMPLRRLDCAGNPLAGIEPFDEVVPAHIRFVDAALPDATLDAALRTWPAAPAAAAVLRAARIEHAVRTGDASALRALRASGDRHLLVERRMTWAEACALAERVGAHLALVADAAEHDAVRRVAAGRNAWIGLVRTADGLRWLDGSAPGFTVFSHGYIDRVGPRFLGASGLWHSAEAGARHGAVLEWAD